MSPSLLYVLNVSNPDRLSSDSGWIFADLLIPALIDAGASVTLVAPSPITDTRCRFLPLPVPATKYRARFATEVEQLAVAVRQTRPDVVIANQIESAPALRTALLEADCDAKLAGYCHYLPFSFDANGKLATDPSLNDADLGHSVLLAFAAGLAACDRILVHSATAAGWVRDMSVLLGLSIEDNIGIVPPPRDFRLVRDPGTVNHPGDESLLAVYNHRLYAHYGTAAFTSLARRLVREAPVWLRVMDLFGTRRPDRSRLDASPEQHRTELASIPGVDVVSDRGNRDRYRELLTGAHLGIAPLREGCPWSMSVIDCQAMGLPVIAPRIGWFTEHINPELLFDTEDDAIELARRLAADSEFYTVQAKAAFASTVDLKASMIAARYLEAVS